MYDSKQYTLSQYITQSSSLYRRSYRLVANCKRLQLLWRYRECGGDTEQGIYIHVMYMTANQIYISYLEGPLSKFLYMYVQLTDASYTPFCEGDTV